MVLTLSANTSGHSMVLSVPWAHSLNYALHSSQYLYNAMSYRKRGIFCGVEKFVHFTRNDTGEKKNAQFFFCT